jgi:hypothetical protein
LTVVHRERVGRDARLATLREAAAYLSERFATVTHSAVLERAIVLLMAAAESGKRKDRAGVLVLLNRGLL